MALKTLGTTGTTVLSALNWNAMASAADLAAISNSIVRQANSFRTSIIPGALTPGGRLQLPGGRGIIYLQPGDYVGVDSWGWPIVVSANSIAAGGTNWAHS